MHYVLAVITDGEYSVDELMARYDESLEVERSVSLTKKDAIEYGRRHLKEDAYDEECWQMAADDYSEDLKDEEGNLY